MIIMVSQLLFIPRIKVIGKQVATMSLLFANVLGNSIYATGISPTFASQAVKDNSCFHFKSL